MLHHESLVMLLRSVYNDLIWDNLLHPRAL